MIAVFDTETRGLFGDVFLIGYYDGVNYAKFTNANEFLEFIYEQASQTEGLYLYAHNLDFDIAKLWKKVKLEVDWSKSLIIYNLLVRMKLKDVNICFCDSLKLLPGSLDKLSQDFGLDTQKIKLDDYLTEAGYKDKHDFFQRVSPNDLVLNEYLENDCRALYELLQKVLTMSGLTEAEFLKCPTTPSLAMRIYRKLCPAEYAVITKRKLSKRLEEIGRDAYVGARVEVLVPKLEAEGYHYDVNSLYPHVMKNSFPVGEHQFFVGDFARFAWELFCSGHFRHGLFKAKVLMPENRYNLGFLPVRLEKLFFPTGRLSGTWVGEELKLAQELGAKVFVEEAVCWREGAHIFLPYIQKMEYEKTYSSGARREFFKLLQNALYGKFGMRRERDSYINFSKAARQKLLEQKKPFMVCETGYGDFIFTRQKVFASYIRPHLAAYVTAYARIYLLQAIIREQERGNTVYYYDTDSIVCGEKMDDSCVDDKKYGYWKLERELRQAIFLQPKLYAELTVCGKEILKSKGLIQEEREKMDFDRYEEIFKRIRAGEGEFHLYSGIPIRRKLMSAFKNQIDPDIPMLAQKRLNLRAKQKREIDWQGNSSKPLQIDLW